MPELNWVAKDKVVTHHLDVPYRVLDRQYSFDETGQSDADNGSENMIIHGDNLEALKALLPKYEGKVDCIYIDPPYNTGNEGWVYNDAVNDPRIKKWLGEVVGKEGDDLTRHDKWLCMMYPRLRLLHRLMARSAVLFVSIDDNEQAKLTAILDEIFGEANRLGTLIQEKGNSKSDTSDIQRNHEYILVYRKQAIAGGPDLSAMLRDRSESLKRAYRDEKGWYRLGDPITTRADGGVLSARPNLGFTIYYSESSGHFEAVSDYDKVAALDKTATENIYSDRQDYIENGYVPIRPPRVRDQLGAWTWQLDKVNEGSDELYIHKTRSGGYQVKKKIAVDEDSIRIVDGTAYEVSERGTNVRSILSFPTSDGTTLLNEILGTGKFPNPKNCSMIEYLISLVDKSDALVLDSFAGSGTTAQAVLNLNKRDDGDRRFILVELEDYADAVTAERVRRTIRGYKDTLTEEHVVFEQKLTLSAVRKGGEVLAEATRVYEEVRAQGKYAKVSMPKVTTKVKGKSGTPFVQVVATQNHDKDVSGTGGSFSFYELGAPLLVDGNLNPEVPLERVREYIWFTETGEAYNANAREKHPDYLGRSSSDTSVFFTFDEKSPTVLDRAYLASIPAECEAETYLIYADTCLLTERELVKHNITFKKIPRDITRL